VEAARIPGPAGADPGSVGVVETRRVTLFDEGSPLRLDSGAELAPVEVAFETYGELDERAGNAVVICHALTGDAHAAGFHEGADRPGWWDNMIGPGKPIDTDRLFVVCANLLGGCMGTTGPSSTDPATGRPYGLRFPLFTVADLVRVHRALVAHLGIRRVMAVVGGSLGGMQALQWTMDAPEEVGAAVIVCASARLSAQNIAFSAVARNAIMADPAFRDGDYASEGEGPDRGLALARMIAHITYLSEESMRRRFGRRIQDQEEPRFGFDVDFQVESYLRHQGQSFLRRFDANSYLYLTRVMDYFDAFGDTARVGERLERARLAGARALVVSFDTDWRFDTAHSREIVRTLSAAHLPVTFREIASPHGHDSFLLVVPEYHRTMATFLGRMADEAEAAARRPGA
jgi:homoserine O-acetyltransferase